MKFDLPKAQKRYPQASDETPELLKFLLRNALIGFGVSLVFVCAMVALNVAHLRDLVFNSPDGLIGFVLLVVLNGLTFASVQIALAVFFGPGANDGDR